MTLPGDTPVPQKGTPQESSHLALAAKMNKFPSLPKEMTKHTPEHTTLASNWTEIKARVARTSTGDSCVYDKCIPFIRKIYQL